MRTVQEVFNVVMDKGYYHEGNAYVGMCFALLETYWANQISQDEYFLAKDDIKHYLLHETNYYEAYLYDLLLEMGWIKKGQYDCSHIYRDWANRPLKPKSKWEQFKEFFKGKLS